MSTEAHNFTHVDCPAQPLPLPPQLPPSPSLALPLPSHLVWSGAHSFTDVDILGQPIPLPLPPPSCPSPLPSDLVWSDAHSFSTECCNARPNEKESDQGGTLLCCRA